MLWTDDAFSVSFAQYFPNGVSDTNFISEGDSVKVIHMQTVIYDDGFAGVNGGPIVLYHQGMWHPHTSNLVFCNFYIFFMFFIVFMS